MMSWPHCIKAMLLEPFIGIVKEVLLAPQHPGQCLPHHTGRVFVSAGRGDRLIERIGVASALVDNLGELPAERVAESGVGQPQPDDRGFAGTNVERIVRCALVPVWFGLKASRRPITT